MQRSVRAAFIAGIILSSVVATPVVAAPPKGGVGEAVQSVNSDYVALTALARSVAVSMGVPAGRLSTEQLVDELGRMEEEVYNGVAYRALIERAEDENASYTALSAIMRTKHDTVLNSINNVR